MSQLPLDQAIQRIQANDERMDRFANGGDTETFLTSGGVEVPSFAKFVKDHDAQLTAFPTLIQSDSGSNNVGFKQSGTGAISRTSQDQLREYVTRSGYDSDANFNAAKTGKLSMDGTGRLRSTTYVAGSEELVSPTTRDAFVVGRGLVGDTNCHGYADRTIISGVTDAGLYGSFDCTVELQGTHNQNHVYSYQDRVRYSGGVGGILQNSCGFLSQTIHSGDGTIQSRNGMQIDPMAITGGGTITSQTGVRVNHLSTGGNNVGVFVGQTTGATGWAIYAPGSTAGVYPLNGAKSYHAGLFGFGLEPIAGVQMSFKYGTDTNNKTGFMSSDTTRVIYGAIGDTPISFVLNGDNRVIVENSAQSYALRPYITNSQSLGLATAYWSNLYATNVTMKPPASVTPANNGEVTFQLTSNTQLTIKAKGSDGVVRSVNLTLS